MIVQPASLLRVSRPRTTAEVAEAVVVCNAAGLAIVPQGGHTGLVGGATPSPAADEVIVSPGRLLT
jgi:FAD/FMN-containing dehydrogenase